MAQTPSSILGRNISTVSSRNASCGTDTLLTSVAYILCFSTLCPGAATYLVAPSAQYQFLFTLIEVYGAAHLAFLGNETKVSTVQANGDDTGYVYIGPGQTIELTEVGQRASYRKKMMERTLERLLFGRWGSLHRQVFCQALPSLCHATVMADSTQGA